MHCFCQRCLVLLSVPNSTELCPTERSTQCLVRLLLTEVVYCETVLLLVTFHSLATALQLLACIVNAGSNARGCVSSYIKSRHILIAACRLMQQGQLLQCRRAETSLVLVLVCC